MFIAIRKRKTIMIIVFCLFFLTGCSDNRYANLVLPNNQIIKVKLARSKTEFTRGLSGIKKMEGYDGMFFMKTKPEKVSFWMKNMKFPLDIIYLDKNLVIVDVFLNNRPCVLDTCNSLQSNLDNVQYILEVPAGLANIYDLSIGKDIQKK